MRKSPEHFQGPENITKGQKRPCKYRCVMLTKNCHSPLDSTRMKEPATVVTDLPHLKGIQGGDQEWGTLLQDKLAEQAFGQLDIFRRFYKPSVLHLLTSRKALKSLMETSAPGDWQQPSAKTCAWLHASLVTKIWPPLSSSEQFLGAESPFPGL